MCQHTHTRTQLGAPSPPSSIDGHGTSVAFEAICMAMLVGSDVLLPLSPYAGQQQVLHTTHTHHSLLSRTHACTHACKHTHKYYRRVHPTCPHALDAHWLPVCDLAGTDTCLAQPTAAHHREYAWYIDMQGHIIPMLAQADLYIHKQTHAYPPTPPVCRPQHLPKKASCSANRLIRPAWLAKPLGTTGRLFSTGRTGRPTQAQPQTTRRLFCAGRARAPTKQAKLSPPAPSAAHAAHARTA